MSGERFKLVEGVLMLMFDVRIIRSDPWVSTSRWSVESTSGSLILNG